MLWYIVIFNVSDCRIKSKVTIPAEAVLTMAQVVTKDSTWFGRLIQIKNVKFTWKNDRDANLNTAFVSLRRSIEKTGNVNAHQLSPVFAPSTYDMNKKYNIGYPMSREVSERYRIFVCFY